jgi:hypothetical protein
MLYLLLAPRAELPLALLASGLLFVIAQKVTKKG